jgi:hypothetical protein
MRRRSRGLTRKRSLLAGSRKLVERFSVGFLRHYLRALT